MTNFYGNGSDIRARKEKTKQNRKFHYNFYDTVTALHAKLLIINQSLQGVGAGVDTHRSNCLSNQLLYIPEGFSPDLGWI